jgi:hypothetical protein
MLPVCPKSFASGKMQPRYGHASESACQLVSPGLLLMISQGEDGGNGSFVWR